MGALQDNSPDRVDALVHGMTALAGITAPTSIAVPTGNMTGGAMTAGYGQGGLGMGMGGTMFGYTPREEEIMETAKDTLERLEQILKSPELFMPKRFACAEGEHPAYFESEVDTGKLLCSRCLHEVEDVDGNLMLKKDAAQLAMSV